MPKSALKIGIVDSGLSLDFLRATSAKVSAAANFCINWEQKILNSTFFDECDIQNWREGQCDLAIDDQSGHGTAVASILYQNIARPVEFYIAKILDGQQSGSAICLLAALRWLICDAKVDFINLSLGTDNWNLHAEMLALVEQASESNCRLFSAAGNIPTLPSELAGVMSVGTSELSRHNKNGVKLDCVALPSSVLVFRDRAWILSEVSTSYACPISLSDSCMAISTSIRSA
jgi:Subtilase family